MNKKERVDAAIKGEAVDHVPASVWGHDFEREWSPQTLADAMVENFITYNWDYMKVNPRAIYHVQDWGVKARPSGNKTEQPIIEPSSIKSAADWKRLRPKEPDQGVLGEQLHALRLINHSVGFDAYFVQTIFCPLGVAKYLVGDNAEPILRSIREDRKALHTALRVIAETFTNFAIASLEEGASGIFYATNGWASEGMLTLDQYREFGEQYDREFFDAIKSRSKFNIIHNCGSHIFFDLLASYPVEAVSWDASLPGNPDLAEGKRRCDTAVMGGIDQKNTLLHGTPAQVREEVGQALEATGGTHFLLAPGCAIAPNTPAKNLEAIRKALS